MFVSIQRFAIIFGKFLLTTYLVKSLPAADFSLLILTMSIVTYLIYSLGFEFSTLMQQRLLKNSALLYNFLTLNCVHSLIGFFVALIICIFLRINTYESNIVLIVPFLFLIESLVNDAVRYFSLYGLISNILTALLFRSFAIPLSYLISYSFDGGFHLFLVSYSVHIAFLLLYFFIRFGRKVEFNFHDVFHILNISNFRFSRLFSYWKFGFAIWIGVLALKTFDPLDKILFSYLYDTSNFVEYSYMQSFALMIPLFSNFVLVQSNMHKYKRMCLDELLSRKMVIRFIVFPFVFFVISLCSYVLMARYYLMLNILHVERVFLLFSAQFFWAFSQIFWLYYFVRKENKLISYIYLFDGLFYIGLVFSFVQFGPDSFYWSSFCVAICNPVVFLFFIFRSRIFSVISA